MSNMEKTTDNLFPRQRCALFSPKSQGEQQICTMRAVKVWRIKEGDGKQQEGA